MSAGTLDLYIEQGATWRKVLTWTDSDDAPVPMADYTARLQIRQAVGSAVVLAYLATAEVAAEDKQGSITLHATNGTITLLMDADATAALNWSTSAHYDLELENGAGVVTRLVQGKARLSKEVTRT